MAIKRFFLGDDAKTKAKKLDNKLTEAEKGKPAPKPAAKPAKKPPR